MFLTSPSGPGLGYALNRGHLNLASMLYKVWDPDSRSSSQTVHRATFSGLAAGVKTEAAEGGSWEAAHLSNIGWIKRKRGKKNKRLIKNPKERKHNTKTKNTDL